MKVSVTLDIDLNYPVDVIGKQRLKKHITDAVRLWGGQMFPDDVMRDAIAKVKAASIKDVMTVEEARSLGGKARWANVSPKKRSAAAKAAARARWGK